MTRQTKDTILLYGVPALVGVGTVLWLASRTAKALEASGNALKQNVENTIRQDVEAQVQPALDSIGITEEVKQRIDQIGRTFSGQAA
jgi:hypothetical protein